MTLKLLLPTLLRRLVARRPYASAAEARAAAAEFEKRRVAGRYPHVVCG